MNTIGKKTSFFEIFNEGNHKIEIPIIQRDYAQGRDTARDIRFNFLKSIRKSIQDNDPIHLDFVYGSIENKVFIPLDGQQRLTTLFLLHWYIAVHEDRFEEFKRVFSIDDESRFTYETRTSSREFCNSLISKTILIPESKEQLLSEGIKDSSWYYISWDYDPTIASMLNMLDSIHNLYFDTDNFFDKFKDPAKIISFQFIELNDFGLTDALYIKMNARGKGLTDFENFKAKFSKILEQQDKKTGTKLKDEFTIKIDTCWTDLFWPFRDRSGNLFDDQFMNFLRVIITNYYSLRIYADLINIKSLIDPKTKFTYYQYHELECFDDVTNKCIISHLNYLIDDKYSFRYYLKDQRIINEVDLFKNVISYDISYPERIQFFALYQYFILGFSIDKLFDWMRVVRNLTENTRIDEIQDYLDALKSISKLLNNGENILEYLADVSNEVSNFATIQVSEERIKAILLLKNDDWRNRITEIENHKYFNGQIGFLLNFSEIEEYYLNHKNFDWENSENVFYLEQFEINSVKANSIFTDNGIRTFGESIFERALLSIGDYTLNKGYNYSFGINGKERDISWKRLLRDNDGNRKFLKELFNKIKSDTIEDDLKSIIKTSNIVDWRRYFIEYPELINVCGKNRFIRYASDDNILLLEKTQTNGMHREYYSYALKIKLERLGNSVSYVADCSVDYPKYINKINKSSIKISFNNFLVTENTYKWCYRIKMKKEYSYYDSMEDILEFLTSNDII